MPDILQHEVVLIVVVLDHIPTMFLMGFAALDSISKSREQWFPLIRPLPFLPNIAFIISSFHRVPKFARTIHKAIRYVSIKP